MQVSLNSSPWSSFRAGDFDVQFNLPPLKDFPHVSVGILTNRNLLQGQKEMFGHIWSDIFCQR